MEDLTKRMRQDAFDEFTVRSVCGFIPFFDQGLPLDNWADMIV